MILRAGSRNGEIPCCSMVCRREALACALAILKKIPGARIFVFYRDIRTTSFSEEVYLQARAAGVVFVPCGPDDAPRVEANGERRLPGKQLHTGAGAG